jgi:hypothetical protein
MVLFHPRCGKGGNPFDGRLKGETMNWLAFRRRKEGVRAGPAENGAGPD